MTSIQSMKVGPHYEAWSAKSGGFGNHTVVDTVLPEMLHLIHAHWYQFPPMNPLWHGILGFVMTVLGITAVTGNGMVMYIFLTTKTLRTPSNLFVVNLSLNDFCMMLCMSPAMVISCYYETWVFGPLFCQLYALAGSLFGCGSIWSMTLIAFDRYNVIVKGLAGKPLTMGGAMLRILLSWFWSVMWTIFPMFGWNRYVPEGNMTACGTDYLTDDFNTKSYLIFYSIACYWLPIGMICYSYWFILAAVSAHEKNMREQAKKMNVASLRSSENQQASTENKLAKVALTTICLWIMAWTPYLVINASGIFQLTTITPLFTIWGSVFAKANCCYNPIIYAISHPKYKIAMTEKFPNLCCAGDDNTGGGRGGDAQSATTAVTDKDAAAA